MKNLTKGMMALMLVIFSSVALMACGADAMDKKLTKDNYNAVVVDTTTYDEVVELLGEQTSGELDDNGDGTLIWKNKKDTKSITLIFDDETVVERTQKGIL